MIKVSNLGTALAVLFLTACSSGQYKNLEANDGNSFSPKLAVENRSDDGKLISLSYQSFSAQDDAALELYATPESPPGSSFPQSADVFMYGGQVLRGAELGDTETNNPRVFSADAQYDFLEGGFYGWWGSDRVAFIPGLLLSYGRASFEVTETGVESDPAHLSVDVNDLSIGFSLGVEWRITEELRWGTHLAKLEGLNDTQSARSVTELKYDLTDQLTVSYGLHSVTWKDNSSSSAISLDSTAHQLGLIYSFE